MTVCKNLNVLHSVTGNEAAAASTAIMNKILPSTVPMRPPFCLTTQNRSSKQNLVDDEAIPEKTTKPATLKSIQQNNTPHQGSGLNSILQNRLIENKPQNVRTQYGRPQENGHKDKEQIVRYRPTPDPRPQENKYQNRNQYNGTQDDRMQTYKNQKNRPSENRPFRKPKTERETREDEECCIRDKSLSVEKLTKQMPSPIKWSQKQPVQSKPDKNAPKQTVMGATKAEPSVIAVKNNIKQPATLDDVTPTRKIVPKKCLVEMLSPGDVVMLSADSKASECRCSVGGGFVCLSLHERHQDEYAVLCEDYAAACEADTTKYTPTPGVTFSYLYPEDGAWYRARCLAAGLAALIDSSKVVAVSAADNVKQLPNQFAAIPEFSCMLIADGVQIGDSLKCTIKTKIPGGYTALIQHTETGNTIGEGKIKRWLPEVEYPPLAQAPAAVTSPSAGPTIPEVCRPDVVGGSRVLLVEAVDIGRALVRGADAASQRRYDSVLHAVVLYGREASPLKIPPQKGQLVVAKYTDGLHYRALCKRTNVKQNKYLIEYIEFGNTEVSTMENLYPCPSEFDLTTQPAEAAVVALRVEAPVITAPATDYLEKLKESATELILTICDGAKTAPSGAEVLLTVADTKVSVNKKLQELCMPDWKKLEQNGVDVVEAVTLMYSDLDHIELPVKGCEIDVLDISSLEGGLVSGYVKGEPLAKKILYELPKQIEAYCNSDIGREPYLPKFEELCVAQCPPYPQWFRAVMCEQEEGAGGQIARVCYIDYGNVEDVDVKVLRKMMPEFISGMPALAAHLEIRDFPKEPTKEMLARALEHMKINDEGRGFLRVTRCERVERGLYLVDAHALIAAMLG